MLKPLIQIALKLLRIKVKTKTVIIQTAMENIIYSTYSMTVHSMGSHDVRTLKALDLYKLA
jgi:hypothetical protein